MFKLADYPTWESDTGMQYMEKTKTVYKDEIKKWKKYTEVRWLAANTAVIGWEKICG